MSQINIVSSFLKNIGFKTNERDERICLKMVGWEDGFWLNKAEMQWRI